MTLDFHSALASVFDSALDAMFIIDASHRVIAWNQAMEKLTGIPRDRMIGQGDYLYAVSFYGQPHPMLADLVLAPSLEEVYSHPIRRVGEEFIVEAFCPSNDKHRYFELRAAPIRDESGQVTGAIEVIRDVTPMIKVRQESNAAQQQLEAAFEQLTAVEEELRQQFEELQHTEAVLRESERRFRTLLEGVQLVAVILDLKREIQFVNDFTLQLTGWQREEVLGRSYLQVFFPDEYQAMVDDWLNEALASPTMVKYGSAPMQTRTGEYRYIDWNSTLLFDGEGRLEGIAILGNDVTARVNAEQQLRQQLNFTNTMIDNLNEMFYTFDQDMRLTFINKKSIEVMGYAPEELIGQVFPHYLVEDEDWEWIAAEARRRLTTGEPASYVLPFLHRDGSKRYLKINSTALWENERIVGAMVLADDITEDIKAAEALRASEQSLRRITDNMLDLISEMDSKGRQIYFSPSHTKILGYSSEEMKTINVRDFVHPDDLPATLRALKNTIKTGVPGRSQQRCRHADGHYIWTETLGNPVVEEGKVTRIILSSRDITDRKRLEEELRYLSVHDTLTGLYNRTYFEEEMTRLEDGRHNPIGVIICDLDGLKLVNDTLGHEAGDRLLVKTGEILRHCFRQGDVVSRVGGDEFAVLLPRVDGSVLEQSVTHVQEIIEQYNQENPQLPLSLSIGTAVREKSGVSIRDTYKEADNNMYRVKLNRSRSARSAVVQTLMKALEARDFITEGHGERIQELVVRMGYGLGLPESVITILRLLAQFHDIGKVGIPDRILFKPSTLTEEEYAEMKRHCEIGHRIALASPELASLADLILKHHEWWNGYGYPLGLRGEQIPLECRILALADAFDAMISDRPYRPAMSREAAMKEIAKYAGTQFDPLLTHRFLAIVQNWEG